MSAPEGDSAEAAAQGVETMELKDDDKPTTATTTALKPVSGQVAAREGITVKGLPSETTLAENVRYLPDPLPHKAYLCDATTDILPCLVEGQVVKVFLPFHGHHSPLLAAPAALLPPYRNRDNAEIALLCGADDTLYAGGASLTGRPSQQPRWALKDKDGTPVVLCRKPDKNDPFTKHHGGTRDRVFHIYGRAPLYDEDEEVAERERQAMKENAEARLKLEKEPPTSPQAENQGEAEPKETDEEEELKDEGPDAEQQADETEEADAAKKEGDKDDEPETLFKSNIVYEGKTTFYPWYQITSYSKGNFDYRFVSVWNAEKQGYEPLAKIRGLTPASGAGPILETTQRLLGTAPAHEAVLLTSIVSDDKHSDMSDEEPLCLIQRVNETTAANHKRDGWLATLAPGMDPALSICAMVIVSDFPEFFVHERNPYASKLS